MNPRLAYPVALVTGALLSLAFPEPDVWVLSWVALAPALAATSGAGTKRGALVWAVFGIGFFGALLSWISVVGWFAWGVLILLETTFVAGFGALWGWLSGRTGPGGRIALAGGAWAAFEFLRSIVPLGGFTWGQLAQSQHDTTWLLQWAAIGGGVFLGGVIAAANASLVEVARRNRATALVALPVIAVIAAGPVFIPEPESADDPITVALVQGNVDPTVIQDFAKDLRILNRHVELTEAIDSDVDLVVWPESAAAIDPDNPVVPPLLTRAATSVGAPMIVGATEDIGDGHDEYRVMAFLVSETGIIVDRYQKTHLVPFGEYVPARELLDWMTILDQIPRDAVPGEDKVIFSVAGGRVAPVLSYEGDFGSLVRSRVAAGGRIVIVGTNTSTWRSTWASAQHVAFSQVRAVENGVPVIHAALSGISAVIEPTGRITGSLGLYRRGTIIEDVAFASSISPYARYGDVMLLAGLAGAGFVWTISRRRQKVTSPDA